MRPLTAMQLLDAWEGAAGRTPVERALALLAAACPDETFERLAALPIGERDGLIFDLRMQTFGPQISAVADCPACGQRLEFGLDSGDLRQAPVEKVLNGGALALDSDGLQVRFRLPTSADLLAVSAAGDVPDLRLALVERCVVSGDNPEGDRFPADLPGVVVDALSQAMSVADPQADIRLAMTCQSCGQAWNAPFDVVAFFWKEIETWAVRTLLEVHRLAQAYGWTLADILQMSAWRRQFFVNLI